MSQGKLKIVHLEKKVNHFCCTCLPWLPSQQWSCFWTGGPSGGYWTPGSSFPLLQGLRPKIKSEGGHIQNGPTNYPGWGCPIASGSSTCETHVKVPSGPGCANSLWNPSRSPKACKSPLRPCPIPVKNMLTIWDAAIPHAYHHVWTGMWCSWLGLDGCHLCTFFQNWKGLSNLCIFHGAFPVPNPLAQDLILPGPLLLYCRTMA